MSGSTDGSARGRVTLQHIADELGVSTATVSLSLRSSPLVAAATRDRVQAVARSLGYVYNRSAASLRTARTNMIAVGFNDIVNPYFGELLAAIEETLAGSGHTVLLGTYSDDPVKQDRVLGTLKEYRPDGMIVCPANGARAASLRDVADAGIPLVQVSREISGVGLDFVGSNDALGTEAALDHLFALGHRRIAIIGGTDAMSTGANRRNAYRTYLAAHGMAVEAALMVEGFGTRDLGFAAVHGLLDLTSPPTAAVCFNDLTAFGVMLGLRHRNREAGRDFSVVGCDDVKEAALWAPGLTTVKNHHADMGRRACERLLARMVNPALTPERIVIEPTLVVRGSTTSVG
ncbi:LacI family DNA-binding transcriptional regulator [Phreatobacter stygius]|uniref:LacI family DNA-binding transcriptional regulator n=1 Tax=Phreatobacter stygius TaxID=1940610 RepID=A0A4D7BDV0_9HYPH|nr:LacI family DNA-binding transcriptional regulator [Phreatobacter stygius]QCI68148.1 LacI family DNA-binding transcriptional regulator [Phreatobacter stygius]